jgi:predicted CoA-binding protein
MSQISNYRHSSRTFTVVGVSTEPTGYDYELFEVLTAHGHNELPVNTNDDRIDVPDCYPFLPAQLQFPDAVTTAAPAVRSDGLAQTWAELSLPMVWSPPGMESEKAIEICLHHHATAIHGFSPLFVLGLPLDCWQDLP